MTMADPREVEAVAQALADLANDMAERAGMDDRYEADEYTADATAAIEALDRFRAPPGCKGCGKPVGAHHERECAYAPAYSTARGYPPRKVNEMQTRIAPVETRPACAATNQEQRSGSGPA
jgi:hypothetical protein